MERVDSRRLRRGKHAAASGHLPKLAEYLSQKYPKEAHAIEENGLRYLHVGEYELPFSIAPNQTAFFKVNYFLFPDGEEYTTLHLGNLGEGGPPLTRINSECLTGRLGSQQCDCEQQLELAKKNIALNARRGIIIFALDQTGKGLGALGHHLVNAHAAHTNAPARLHELDLVRKAYEDAGVPHEHRTYANAAAILRFFGVHEVHLYTSNPDKTTALENAGIKVTEQLPLTAPSNPFSRAMQTFKAALFRRPPPLRAP